MVDKVLSKAELYDLLIKHLEDTRPQLLSEFYNTIENSRHTDSHNIPADIFIKEITPLEAITKYLKENLNLSYKDIGLLLQRNERNIWHTYSNSQKKFSEAFTLSTTPFLIPINILSNSKLSVPESLISYLKDSENLNNNQIAKLLNRNQRTIWTTYYRAKKKLTITQPKNHQPNQPKIHQPN